MSVSLVKKEKTKRRGRPPAPQGYFDFRPRIRLPQKYLPFKDILQKNKDGRNIASHLIEQILDEITSSCQDYDECKRLILEIVENKSLSLTTDREDTKQDTINSQAIKLGNLDLSGLIE
ncbi:MAG: hypothetical protein QXM53_06795 [Thermofilaceae archaeon]